MGDCCRHDGYDDTFGSRFSRRLARRYRRRGLDKTAARMVAFIAEHGVNGAAVLETGGGVGAIQVELLRRGAVRTTNLELVDTYEADAKALAVAAGVADLITRRQVDIATSPRTYVHDPDALVSAAERGTLRASYRHRGLARHVVGLTPAAR